jgi:threonylcarbamoyladenosine tRNA methylthiotransferase MtaB
MRIYLDQIGCRLNYSEVETLAGRLRAAGHVTVSAPEEAQVIVFNSCAVTAEAGRKSRQRVRHFHRTNPDARIALTGCWATLQPRQAAELPGVALVTDNSRKDLLHTLLEPWSAELDDPDDLARTQPCPPAG